MSDEVCRKFRFDLSCPQCGSRKTEFVVEEAPASEETRVAERELELFEATHLAYEAGKAALKNALSAATDDELAQLLAAAEGDERAA